MIRHYRSCHKTVGDGSKLQPNHRGTIGAFPLNTVVKTHHRPRCEIIRIVPSPHPSHREMIRADTSKPAATIKQRKLYSSLKHLEKDLNASGLSEGEIKGISEWALVIGLVKEEGSPISKTLGPKKQDLFDCKEPRSVWANVGHN